MHICFTGLAILITGAALVIACAQPEQREASAPTPTHVVETAASSGDSATRAAEARPTPTAALTATAQPKFDGFEFAIGEGTFWDFRWSSSERSCAQGRGCSSDEVSGLFSVALGEPRNIQGSTAYEVEVTGDPGTFAPPWRYLALENSRILGSRNGSSLVVLFDGQTGAWAGSGFFETRFDPGELSTARPGTIADDEEIAGWAGVVAGPAIVVGRAASQSECEIIEGRRICPRQESYSFAEREWYRAGVGAVGYHFKSSSSYSGGGFFSSYSSEENVALMASSLRGDVPTELAPELPDLTEFAIEFLTEAVNAEIATYSSADDSYISKVMTGQPLRHVRDNLARLSARGVVHVPSFDFDNSATINVRTLSDSKIEADRCEIWSGEYRDAGDDTLASTEPADLVPQTITIERLAGGWFITQIAFHDAPSFC